MYRLIPVKTVIGTDAQKLVSDKTMYTEDGNQSKLLKAGIHQGHLNDLYYKLDSKNSDDARLISIYHHSTIPYGKDTEDDYDVKPYVFSRHNKYNGRR